MSDKSVGPIVPDKCGNCVPPRGRVPTRTLMTDRQRGVSLFSTILVCVSTVAVVDWLTPLHLDVWVLYLPIVLVSVWLNASQPIVLTAVTCTVLMGADAFLSQRDTSRAFVLGNLSMGLTALWLTTLAGITIVKRSRELARKSRSLIESEERLRLAMEGAGMGTWDRDLRSNKSIWSDTHFRMLGYVPTLHGDASIDLWQSVLHPDDLDRVLEAQEQSRLNRILFCTECRIRRADNGRIAWLAVFGRFSYNEAGEAVRFLGVSFDITQRKDLERKYW